MHIITYGQTAFAKQIKGVGSCAWIQETDGSWFKVRVFTKFISDAGKEEIFHLHWSPSATRKCLLLGSIRDACIYPLPKGYWFISSYS